MKSKNKKILDIGCGNYKTIGSIGMDKIKLEGVDVVHDITKIPYPFKDSEFDEIHCYHIIEHIADVIKFMEELYRIIKPEGVLYIRVPHASCIKSAWTDPTHIRPFTVRSFYDYFGEKSKFGYYSKTNFQVITQKMNYCLYDGQRETSIPRWWQLFWNKIGNFNFNSQNLFERFLAQYIGGYEELYVELKAIKQ